MTRFAWVCIALSLTAFVQVEGQDRRLTERLPAGAVSAVQMMVDSAARMGLPTEPLVDLALEGAAKGASGERIIGAVDRLWQALVTARVALGDSASAAELTVGAYALRQGLSEVNLELLRASRSGDLTVPLTAALDLAGRGVTPDSAAVAVSQLAARGDDRLLRRLVQEVDRSLAGGLTPEQAWQSARLQVQP